MGKVKVHEEYDDCSCIEMYILYLNLDTREAKMLKGKWKLSFFLISIVLIVVVSNYFTRDKYTVNNEDTIKKVVGKETFELLNYKIVNTVDKPFSLIAYKDHKRIGVGMLTIVNGQEEFVR
ncbi:hypothetical protein [Paenibacillus sp. 8b26]|uniref:hypothetical protein n=1 Tax=Paenibacillus sp. 8b26 TaxID=3424133 RepID=UPI003D65383D